MEQGNRDSLPGEPKCTLSKGKRYRIGQSTSLPLQGLIKPEWAARQRWDRLSDSQKTAKKAELRKVSPFITGNQANR
jgi:hypothetical protein